MTEVGFAGRNMFVRVFLFFVSSTHRFSQTAAMVLLRVGGWLGGCVGPKSGPSVGHASGKLAF